MSTAKIPRSVREWDQFSAAPSHDRRNSRRASARSSQSRARARSQSAATSRRELIIAEEPRGESSVHGGVGALVVARPPSTHRGRGRDDRIRDEIKQLEKERRRLREERDVREEVVLERRGPAETVEVRKDRKGKMSLVYP